MRYIYSCHRKSGRQGKTKVGSHLPIHEKHIFITDCHGSGINYVKCFVLNVELAYFVIHVIGRSLCSDL